MPSLKVTGGGKVYDHPIKLADSPVVIGRAHTCDVQIEDNLASRKHCRIVPGPNGAYTAEDLGSRNGTLLNNKPLSNPTPLNSGDVIKIGAVEIAFDAAAVRAPKPPPVNEPPKVSAPTNRPESAASGGLGAPGMIIELILSGGWGRIQRVLDQPVLTVGRGDDANIKIDEPLASRVHAQFELKAGGVKVIDLESRNGTRVNGQTVNQKFLAAGDVVEIGDTKIEVTARPPEITGEMAAGPVREELARRRNPTSSPSGSGNLPMPVLSFADNGTTRRVTLHNESTVVGRSEKVQVTIQEPLASREHIVIRRLPNGTYELEDLASRNGTKLNGRDVRGRIQIVPGDVITIGATTMTFEMPGVAQGPAAGLTSSSPTRAMRPESAAVATNTPTNSPGGAGGAANSLAVAETVVRRRRTRGPGSGADATLFVVIGGVLVVIIVIVAISMGSGSRPSDYNSDATVNAYNSNNFPTFNPLPNSNHSATTNHNANRPRPNANVGNNTPANHGNIPPNPTNQNAANNAPVNRPRPQYDEEWVNARGLSENERRARQEMVAALNEVNSFLENDLFGPAIARLEAFIVKWEQATGGAEVVKIIDGQLTKLKTQAREMWRNRYVKKIQDTERGKRESRWKAEIEEKFAGLRDILAEAQELLK